jgi:hypothetical protein
MNRMSRFMLVCLAVLSLRGLCADNPEGLWSEYRKPLAAAANALIDAKDKRTAYEKWRKDMTERSKESDRPVLDMALDWFADNEGGLKKKDINAVLKACFWFVSLNDSNEQLPAQMRERMTKENFEDCIKVLKELAK